MEMLKRKLKDFQCELEDAFRMETDKPETKDGRRLLNYLRKRHRVINGVIRVLEKI